MNLKFKKFAVSAAMAITALALGTGNAKAATPAAKPGRVDVSVAVKNWTGSSMQIGIDPMAVATGGAPMAGITVPGNTQIDHLRSDRVTIARMPTFPQGSTGSCTLRNYSVPPTANTWPVPTPPLQATWAEFNCTITDTVPIPGPVYTTQTTTYGNIHVIVSFERQATVKVPARTLNATVQVGHSVDIRGLLDGVTVTARGHTTAATPAGYSLVSETVTGANRGTLTILNDNGVYASAGDMLRYEAGSRPGTDTLTVAFCGPDTADGSGAYDIVLMGCSAPNERVVVHVVAAKGPTPARTPVPPTVVRTPFPQTILENTGATLDVPSTSATDAGLWAVGGLGVIGAAGVLVVRRRGVVGKHRAGAR